MKFKLKRIALTEEEKRERAEAYKEFDDPDFNVEEFVKQDIYDEFVDFKCLDCGALHENMEADILFELFDPEFEEYPELICNFCDNGTIVPIDVYDEALAKHTKNISKRRKKHKS